jgi:hypothetical protein
MPVEVLDRHAALPRLPKLRICEPRLGSLAPDVAGMREKFVRYVTLDAIVAWSRVP